MPDLGVEPTVPPVAPAARFSGRQTVMLKDNPGLLLTLAFLTGILIVFWKQVLALVTFVFILVVLIGAADVFDQIRSPK
jgi:hypothetical protein